MRQIIINLLIVLGSYGLSFSQKPSAVTVMIRVLDYKSGRPVKHHRIGLLLGSVADRRDWTHHIVKKTTCSDGTAVFELSSLPSEMSLVENGMEVTFPTAEVIGRGAVAYSYDAYSNRPLPWPIVKQPGELVVYTHRYNPLQRFTRFLSDVLCFCP
jgi:hypothetical protein